MTKKSALKSDKMKQLSILSFAAKGLPPNWSVKSPTLAEDATILDVAKPKRGPGRPCKKSTPIFSLDEPAMPGTACEVEEIADSEVEEAEGSECDLADEVGEVSAPEVATTELTVAGIVAAANTASSLSQPKKYCTWPEGLSEVLVPLLGQGWKSPVLSICSRRCCRN